MGLRPPELLSHSQLMGQRRAPRILAHHLCLRREAPPAFWQRRAQTYQTKSGHPTAAPSFASPVFAVNAFHEKSKKKQAPSPWDDNSTGPSSVGSGCLGNCRETSVQRRRCRTLPGAWRGVQFRPPLGRKVLVNIPDRGTWAALGELGPRTRFLPISVLLGSSLETMALRRDARGLRMRFGSIMHDQPRRPLWCCVVGFPSCRAPL